ncbi:hypothetical protein GCM10011402_35840 [Paracoccus acridae]|uniref:DUF883 domain-containing protein n=1 Tax=Paracoccus acridae TaxID=1795310 RepID=A0ABQ1VM12_9RHOB|nr:DUF883 family protein [Paracoccus acridae]GGF80044.1 hypothetical protein GCM10011402_35840 [Paracoccus acridae]
MTQKSGFPEKNEDAASLGEETPDLQDDTMSLAERASTLASDAMEGFRGSVQEVRAVGQDYAGKALDMGKRKAEEAAFYTELGYEEAIDYVRQRPIAALSMAMGIGLVLGLAAARR